MLDSFKQKNHEKNNHQEFGNEQVEEESQYEGLTSNMVIELKRSQIQLFHFIEQYSGLVRQPIRQDVRDFVNVNRNRAIFSVTISSQCITKYVKFRVNKILKNKKIKQNWNIQDIRLMIWLISSYSNIHSLHFNKFALHDWQIISSLIPGSNSESVMFKWLSLRKNNLSDEQWRQDQRILLQQLTRTYGAQNWSIISKLLYLNNQNPNKIFRGPKQCRQHWNCYLNPKLKKGPWELQQDFLLMKLVGESGGNKKWASFVKKFNGRTENALKNRYKLIVDKELKINQQKEYTQLQAVDNYIVTHSGIDFTLARNQKQAQNVQKNQDKDKIDFYESRRQKINTDINSQINFRKNKKNLQIKDEDWLDDLKKQNYLSFRKLEKNDKSIQKSQPKITTRRYRKHKAVKIQHETLKKSEQPFQRSTEKQESGYQKNIRAFNNDPFIKNQPSQQKEIIRCQNNQAEEKRKQKQYLQNLYLKRNQNEIQQNISLNQIKIVEITKQKLEELRSFSRQFIPCQLTDDRLQFIERKQ